MNNKTHDIIIFGATSFVGELICEYMLKQFGTSDLSWALAGRSETKLKALQDQLGDQASSLPIIIADAGDLTSLKVMCQQSKVIMSTVGPYDLYGEPLIQACAETGTDYCDLTGEAHWIKNMLDKYESTARQSGARIVHCAGFDSIPSDLGVHFLQQTAKKLHGKHCNQVKLRIRNMRGAASGGTIATALNIAKKLKTDPQVKKVMVNPYSLCPEGHGFKTRQKEIKLEFDETFNKWTAPFFMSVINTRIVHRSNALSNHAYGNDFKYNEGMMTSNGFKGKMRARSIYWGLGAFFAGISIKPIRSFLGRFVLPKPGEGPSKEEQQNGFYDFRFVGTTVDGEVVMTKVYGDMDPGYGSTAKIISQTAACMAQDVSDEVPGGFWTPATLMGDTLVERLNRNSGLTFEVLENS